MVEGSMKYFILFCLVTSQVFAADKLGDFNKELMEKFDQDIRTDNDVAIKKDQHPSRGPASVAPEMIEEENKINKTVRQTGHRDW
jgi:hypothetical protein